VNLGGLGYDILQGLPLRRFDQMLGSAMVIMVLALAIDGVFGLVQKFAVPRGVAAGQKKELRTPPVRRRAVVGTPIEPERG
jgi:osmoprotectant transport system permease protein